MDKIQNLSPGRKESIKISNRKFDEFCLNNYKKSRDEIIVYVKTLDNEEREDQLLDLAQEWLNHLHKTLVVSSIRVKITDINRYLKYHKIGMDTKDLEWPQEMHEEPYAVSLEEISEILKVAKWKKQGYLALISTGSRPIEIIGLKKQDIQWNYDFRCYTALIPARLTKKKMARTIKFSKEVNPYLKKLLDNARNALVFCKNPNLDDARSTQYGNIVWFYTKI